MALNFTPELWSANTLVALRKAQVYGQTGVVNRDYEGEIRAQGDTVRIRSLGRPTISSYTKGSALTYEQLTDAQRSLLIDQAKSFSFAIDDIDTAQQPGGALDVATSEAAYGLADAQDQFIAALYTQAQSANQLGTVSVTTGDIAYNTLVDLGVRLDEANVPSVGRWVVVPPWYHGLLRKSTNFVTAEKRGDGGAAVVNGVIGEAAGFMVMKSNNAPLVTGDDYAVMAGYSGAITMAEQITEIETLRLQSTFANAVRGLLVYGAKVVRPDGIATVIASKT